jgi:hypothetical protein
LPLCPYAHSSCCGEARINDGVPDIGYRDGTVDPIPLDDRVLRPIIKPAMFAHVRTFGHTPSTNSKWKTIADTVSLQYEPYLALLTTKPPFHWSTTAPAPANEHPVDGGGGVPLVLVVVVGVGVGVGVEVEVVVVGTCIWQRNQNRISFAGVSCVYWHSAI